MAPGRRRGAYILTELSTRDMQVPSPRLVTWGDIFVFRASLPGNRVGWMCGVLSAYPKPYSTTFSAATETRQLEEGVGFFLDGEGVTFKHPEV